MSTLPSSLSSLSSKLAALPDHELLTEVGRLAGDERGATARLIASLAEVDKRQLYRDVGCSSLFTYCTEVLKLSEHAAYLRMEAARAARRFPLILDRLAEGTLTLSAVSMLAKHLTGENHRELLDEARHQSKRALEMLVARIDARADAPPIVRRLPSPRQVAQRAATAAAEERATSGRKDQSVLCPVESDQGEEQRVLCPAEGDQGTKLPGGSDACGLARGEGEERPTAAGPAALRRQGAIVCPIAPERYKVQVTIGADTHAKLRRVQDLLRHVIPNGDPAQIFDRALTVLLADLEKSRLAAAARPRAPRRAPAASDASAATVRSTEAASDATGEPSRTSEAESRPRKARSRHIPAAVKRLVWARDEGRCTFVGTHGRCTERGLLEFHHRIPFAAGGPATVENLEIRCKSHNGLEADRFFMGREPRGDGSSVRTPRR